MRERRRTFIWARERITDGIIEAPDSSGDEFGEAQLIEAIQSQGHLSPSALLANIYAAVQKFSSGVQADDLTLVIGRPAVMR